MTTRAIVRSTLTVVVGFVLSAGALAATGNETVTDADLPAQATYARDVAPILDANCIACHREGDIAPMSLRSYDEVRPWARSIRKAVLQRDMPPWHAEPEHGDFRNDRSLSDHEIAIIDRWVEQGAPLGDPAERPEAPAFDDDWRLGEPDLVVSFEEVSLPGDGPDVFRDLIGQLEIDEGTWLRAVEVKPGNRQVVHHVIIYATDGQGPPESGWLGAWAAGMEPMVFPEGTAKRLEPGQMLVADMHYHPSGEPATDSTRIGLYFHDGEPEKELINLWIQNSSFAIPAGAENHEVRADFTFQQDAIVHGLLPHMHYRGKDFTYVAHYPDGEQETLLEVRDYDFNWQTLYQLEEPKEMPAGTRIECVAHYDNSAANPDNPDPTRTVTFGNESYDEMMIGFVDMVVKEGMRPAPIEERVISRLRLLHQDHPGEVWRLEVREADEQGSSTTALWLPRAGEGVWIIPIQGQIQESQLVDVVLEDGTLEARLISPVGNLEVRGRIDGNRLEGTIAVPFDDDDLVFEGERLDEAATEGPTATSRTSAD